MKTPTFLSIIILALVFFIGLQGFAQNYVPFTPRFNQDLKGDIVLIGNNILGPDNNAFNDNDAYNHEVDMQYIDIDNDSSTFSSSSADLEIPNPNCYRIIYAGLYWGAVNPGDEPITEVKFKGPSGGYNDITGTIIYDADGNSVDGGNSFSYACFADVTGIVTAFGSGSDLGTYTVANVSSGLGETAEFDPYNGTGQSAGWSLFIVYEDPTLPGKSITSFDGFSAISISGGNEELDVPVSGFRTVPAPAPVRANFAFATLEGDSPIQGDQLLLNGIALSATDRPEDNFFNSSVTQLDATPVNNRNPNSTNTLGFDTGVLAVPNPNNTVIANDATSATVTLETQGDTYFPYFFAFAVEIIEPNIVLTKIVEDDSGNNIGGQAVGLSTPLNYVIGFQNTGNDDATNLQIRDILPVNIIYNHPTDLVLPAGVTVASYDVGTRELILDIDNSLVEEGDPGNEIRIEVQTVDSCAELSDACANIINNQAFATYNGFYNPTFQVTDDPSINSNTGCLLSPQATNFLINLDCTFEEDLILCGSTLTLTAADGYASYSWSTSPTGTPVIGTTQSIIVSDTGTYYSFNSAIAPCQSIEQQYNVSLFGDVTTNPVIPFADEVVVCPNDGKELPNIYLCGAEDFVNIDTNISGVDSIIWEQLDESSCPAVSDFDCANEDGSCTWNQVATGPDFIADTAGQFRLTINYEGGCFVQFYFNVYENLLNPSVTSEDIICTTPGNITVNDVPSGYEYSLDGINWQSSNVFTVNTAGVYTVYIRQIGITTNPCIFTVPDVLIRERDFTISTTVAQPLCNGDLGSISISANDVEPQYTFELSQGGTLVNTVGPITENSYSFENLNTGTYTITASTEDGCILSEDITIVEPPLLTVTATLTTPLTCTDGEITIYPQGGTAPYFYFINSTTDFQTVPTYGVSSGGTYNITIVDANNCEASTTLSVDTIPDPEFTISKTDILCYGENTGEIAINVTNTNGYSLQYSIDNGVTFSSSNIFTGLNANDYEVLIQYSLGGVDCITSAQTVSITQPDAALTGSVEVSELAGCQPNGNGVIRVINVSGGTPFSMPNLYEYSFDNQATWVTTNEATVAPGIYTIYIRDTNGCIFAVPEIILDPELPTPTISISDPDYNCDGSANTTVTVTNNGGVNYNYTYLIDGVENPNTANPNVFLDVSPGNHIITVQYELADATTSTSCEEPVDFPFIVPTGNAFDASITTFTDPSCEGATDGSITIAAQNFDTTTGYQYSINGQPYITTFNSPETISGLSAGTYNVAIRYDDAVDTCAFDFTQVITNPDTLQITVNTTDVSCIIGSTVTVSATGGTPNYTYQLSDVNSPTTIINFEPNGIGGILNDIAPGTYTIEATDSQGCSANTTIIIDTPENPTATIDAISDYCYDSNNAATLTVNASGGLAPYQYSINGNPFVTINNFTNLTPDTYSITVRDANGCEFTLEDQVIANELIVSAAVTKALDCTSSPDAIITTTFSGGYAPYTYEVDFNSSGYMSQGATTSPITYSTSNPGDYQFRITDSRGCSVETGVITVNPLSPPSLLAVVQSQNINCNGESTGAIDIAIDPNTGVAPFIINVNNDTTGTNYGNQTTSLPAGSYTVTVTDANACTDTAVVVISEPDAIVVTSSTVDITCTASGVSQGSVIVNSVTGGTAPYNYFVTGTNGYSNSELNATGSTSVTFDVVDFGLYQINVIDANGCSVLIQDALVASPPSDLDIIVTPIVDCTTGGEALVTVSSALSSSGPFFFSIYQEPFVPYTPGDPNWIAENPAGSASTVFTGLMPGVTYTFVVYDAATNCSYFEVAEDIIPTNSTLTLNAQSSNNITCTGNADGNVSFTVQSTYTTAVDISYQIFESQSLNPIGSIGTDTVPANGSLTVTDFGALPFGNYFVYITETTGPNIGCGIVTAPFNITESEFPLNLNVSVNQNANCNANSGVISAIAENGAAPYVFQITTSPTAPIASDLNWDFNSTFNLDAGTYYVHVRDIFGCIVSSPATILPQDPSPIISASINNECVNVDGTFQIDVNLDTPGIAPYSVSVDGGAFQTQTFPFSISDLPSGTHTIEVNDANGCGNTETITILQPLISVNTVSVLPSCTVDDGEILINSSGGSGNYAYSISPNPSSINLGSGGYTGVPSGTYTITVTDTNTLCSIDTFVTLEAPTPVVFTATGTDNLCNGDANGTIVVDLPTSNDNPIYTFALVAPSPVIVPAQNNSNFTNLPAGTYTVEVISERGCSATQQVVINEPNVIDIIGTSIVQYNCDSNTNTLNFASISVTNVTGGSGNYITYEFINDGNIVQSGSSDTYIESDGVGGNYIINVYDDNGCVGNTSSTIIINPYIELDTLDIIVDTPITCTNLEDITVIANTTGGIASNLSYTVEDIIGGVIGSIYSETNTTGTFTGLDVGNYIITVNNLDTGCSIETTHFVNNPNTFDLLIDTLVDVTCFDDNDGSANITIVDLVVNSNDPDQSGAFNYTIIDTSGTPVVSGTSTDAGPITIDGLFGGTYSITASLTNNPFCEVTKNFTITQPTSILDLVVNQTANVTCDNNQGVITAVASGGWGNHEYELTGDATVAFSPNGTFEGLAAGNYIVNVRDAQGCIVSEPITLDPPAPISATFTPSVSTLACLGDSDASITISNVTGGQGANYTYTLNVLAPVVASSGPQTSNVFDNLGAGTYSVTINDGFNCELISADIVIDEPTQVEANLVLATTQTCLTEATLTLSANGGTPPYSYSSDANFTNVLGTFNAPTTFGVSVGTHAYYVRDANGCVANISNDITIEPLQNLTIELFSENPTINCAGDNTGSISATATGGLGNYLYTLQDTSGNTINAIQNSPGYFTELIAGTYVVMVESGDCNETSETITITEPDAALEATLNITNIRCAGSNDGVIEVNATGGTGIIKYAISPQLNQFFDTNTFENLAPGEYTLIVQDELGCFLTFTEVITEPAQVLLSIVPNSIFPEVCEGEQDGEFSVEISGGTLPYSVSLDDPDGPYTTGAANQTQFDFTNLTGGDHVVYVRDAEGCESEWNISMPPSVRIEPTVDIVFDCEQNTQTNTVTVMVDDSITDMSELDFSLDGGPYQQSNVFTNVPVGGGHYVDARHTNGCIQRTSLFDIVAYEPVTLTVSDGDLNEYIMTGAGGTGIYTYTVDGQDYGSDNTFTITASGVYELMVTDTNGCTAIDSVELEFVDICPPNYFTPNGDGIQDTWAPGCTNNYPNLQFDIFDRYGRKVGTYTVGQYWDGRYNGNELPTGDYWYVVRPNGDNNERSFVGHFTLYR